MIELPNILIDKAKYYLTKEWKEKAEQCKKLANYSCSMCGATGKLQAHHLTYKNLGNEAQGDLLCVCKSCHEELHEHALNTCSIKKLNRKVCYMDLIETQSNMCKSSKDILLFGKLFEDLTEENYLNINVSKFAKTQDVSRSKVTNMLALGVKCGFLKRIDRGVYAVNPFILRGTRFRSNAKFEQVQKQWDLLKNEA